MSSQPVPSAADVREAAISVNELGNVRDALKPITELLTAMHEDSVRLYCTVPTWSPSSDICIDLHDLNTLRSRSLHFIHDLVNSLRESGVRASYKLMPSNSPLCLISHDAYTKMKMRVRERVLLVESEGGPALVVT